MLSRVQLEQKVEAIKEMSKESKFLQRLITEEQQRLGHYTNIAIDDEQGM